MNPRDRKLLPVSPDEWMKHALSDLKFAKLGQKKKDILYHIAVQINSNARGVTLISLGFWNDIRPF